MKLVHWAAGCFELTNVIAYNIFPLIFGPLSLLFGLLVAAFRIQAAAPGSRVELIHAKEWVAGVDQREPPDRCAHPRPSNVKRDQHIATPKI